MRLVRHWKLERRDVWREGKWIDLWSIVHLLSGASFGLVLGVLNLGTTASIVITFLSFVLYETWEAMVKIIETPQNRFMDVVLGMVSFIPVFLFSQGSPTDVFILAFGFTLTANIVMATLGWLESRKADEFEERMRARLAERRKRIVERRVRQPGMNV